MQTLFISPLPFPLPPAVREAMVSPGYYFISIFDLASLLFLFLFPFPHPSYTGPKGIAGEARENQIMCLFVQLRARDCKSFFQVRTSVHSSVSRFWSFHQSAITVKPHLIFYSSLLIWIKNVTNGRINRQTYRFAFWQLKSVLNTRCNTCNDCCSILLRRYA